MLKLLGKIRFYILNDDALFGQAVISQQQVSLLPDHPLPDIVFSVVIKHISRRSSAASSMCFCDSLCFFDKIRL